MTDNDTKEQFGRFGHHPDPAIDFCVEVEELESIAENARLGLTGFGHEQDREALNRRLTKALEFRVGGDDSCIAAKQALRLIVGKCGFSATGEAAYAGQLLREQSHAH